MEWSTYIKCKEINEVRKERKLIITKVVIPGECHFLIDHVQSIVIGHSICSAII